MNETDNWVPVIKALADPSRLELVRTLLNERECSVQQLAKALDSPSYQISKQLSILRNAGIVISEKLGRTLHNKIAPDFERNIDENRTLDLGCCTFHFDRPLGKELNQ